MPGPVVSLRSLRITVPDGKVVTFISDVHLGFGTPDSDQRRQDLLLTTLRKCAETSAHLVIVGDLFDLWFDYETVVPKSHVRTLAALNDLVLGGVAVTYLMGNHDFGHYKYFRESLGIEVDSGDVALTINGTKVYVSHGDGKARNDAGYLLLRGILRNRFAQWLYRWIHPDIGIRLASSTSHGSRDYTSAKDYGPEDGLRDFALARIDEGYDLVIMGHRHRATVEPHNNGSYINLGHWLDEGATYGVFSPQSGFRLIHLPSNAPV